MRGGWSLDIGTIDPVTGRAWNLLDPRDQARAKSMVRQHKPRLLVLSPPCTAFSNLQYMSGGPDLEKLKTATLLFEFAVELARIQVRQGGLFMIEHPQTSSAWHLPCTQQLLRAGPVVQADFHMCRHGMVSSDEFGEGKVLKPTRVWTNSSVIAEKMELYCQRDHRHVRLLHNRAKAC